MAKVKIYRTYRWIDKDPIIDAVRTVCKDERLSNNYVHQISGVSTTTLDNWFVGDTRKPQNATVTAVTSALGYVRRDNLRANGQVDVGYTKARSLDYNAEVEKQADWILKQMHKSKKKKNSK